MLTRTPRRPVGAATVEFHLVALLAAIPLCTGVLQTGLLLVANHQVDLAAFLAARSAAVAGGDAARAREVFRQSLSPLWVRTQGGVDGSNVAARVLEAQAANAAAFALFSRVEILAPGTAEIADFSIMRRGRRVIPNDSLDHRDVARGTRSGLTLQEANVLRLAASYCHRLIVPFAAQLLLGTLRWLDTDPWHQLCYASGRVPLRSVAAVPMQSDFVVR